MGNEDIGNQDPPPPESLQPIDPRVEKVRLLWDEYKYRHDLVWKVLFQVTAAVVILAIVPYLAPIPVIHYLGWRVLATAALASALALFSIAVVNNEEGLLGKIRTQHRRLQMELFPLIRHKGPEEKDWRNRLFSFGFLANVYLSVLVVLSVANIVICALYWIPYCVSDQVNCGG